MRHNDSLVELDLSNLVSVGDYFLYNNKSLISLNAPNLSIIGDEFLSRNNSIVDINLPSVVSIGGYFFSNNNKIVSLSMENLVNVGDYFLFADLALEEINMPNLVSVGDYFLALARVMDVSFPKLKRVGYGMLFNKINLNSIYVPSLDYETKVELAKKFSLDVCELDVDNRDVVMKGGK